MDVEHPQQEFRSVFSIRTDVYSGPLDLLIDLIERRKLLINDISLSSVTDDYIAYVAQNENNPLRDMADFIVLASTLLLLKSKSLLPVLEFTEEEEETVDSLEKRLRYYQIFRNAGKKIELLFGTRMSYEKVFIPSAKPLFITDKRTNLDSLTQSISDVVANLPHKVEKPKVSVKKVISLETMIDQLKERIQKQFAFRFGDFADSNGERSVVIVGFLAVLEMVKQGTILVRQTAHFHDIEIEAERHSVPRYN